MLSAHTPHDANCRSPALRYSGTLLVVLVGASLLLACGGGTSGDWAPAAAGPPPPPPDAAALTWDAVSVPSFSGYRVYYGTQPGTYQQSFGQGLDVQSVTTYTVTGLSSATKYYFAVTAYDLSNIESGYSNEVFKVIP